MSLLSNRMRTLPEQSPQSYNASTGMKDHPSRKKDMRNSCSSRSKSLRKQESPFVFVGEFPDAPEENSR
jgi:hypothetical protein